MKRNGSSFWIVFSIVIMVFFAGSYVCGFQTGKEITRTSLTRFAEMFRILPLVFLLLGQFETWVSRTVVERHLGTSSGIMAYIWVLLLGGATIGPMLVALPVAKALHDKGARLSVVSAYLGSAAVCRIPMTMFEASCLGIGFTLIRYAVAVPLIIITSVFLEKLIGKPDGKIPVQSC